MEKKINLDEFKEYLNSKDIHVILIGIIMLRNSINIKKLSYEELDVLYYKLNNFWPSTNNYTYVAMEEIIRIRGKLLNKIHNQKQYLKSLNKNETSE